MTQTEVYTLLKKKGDWMTTKEIAKILKVSPGNVATNLSKLFKYGEVLRESPRSKVFEKYPQLFQTGYYGSYKWKIK